RCGEKRTGTDIRMQQSAGDRRQPGSECLIHSVGNSAPQHYLAHQDEKRNGDQDKVVEIAPGKIAKAQYDRPAEQDNRTSHPEKEEDCRDRKTERGKGQQKDEIEKANPHHLVHETSLSVVPPEPRALAL